MKTTTWTCVAPNLEAVQVTDANRSDVVAWLLEHGAHAFETTDTMWFTDDNGAQRSPLEGDWVCLDPQRKTFRLVDEHVMPALYKRT